MRINQTFSSSELRLNARFIVKNYAAKKLSYNNAISSCHLWDFECECVRVNTSQVSNYINHLWWYHQAKSVVVVVPGQANLVNKNSNWSGSAPPSPLPKKNDNYRNGNWKPICYGITANTLYLFVSSSSWLLGGAVSSSSLSLPLSVL